VSTVSTLADVHVLVAGAGGIGCPAVWALAAAGVGRITLLDPDVVERSNLPRQILYRDADLGAPKAVQAAAALGRMGFATDVRARHAALDHTNAQALLADVDVLVDATDGAHAKDWLNQLAVRRGVALVHAAGLRAEARLLSIAPGGRPCLTCLFGRLTEETGSCADLGVWNGAVGVVGFLAAQRAIQRATGCDGATGRYAVLDFEVGRATGLRVAADAACPVCAGEPAAVEPYPDEPLGCAAETPAPPAPSGYLDLGAERCPLNLLRARRALADLPFGAVLEIRLGAEGAATVPDGVRALGHTVLSEVPAGAGLDLRVQVGAPATATPALDGEILQRYARQIVLPEVGERGQRTLLEASVWLGGEGPAAAAARRYLEAAGVGSFVDRPAEADVCAWAGGLEAPDLPADAVRLVRGEAGVQASRTAGPALGAYDVAAPVALAWGALLADLVQRVLVLAEAPAGTLHIGATGTPA